MSSTRRLEFNFDFMSQTRIAVALTALITLGALGTLGLKGLNFGIDFTGGTLVELGYDTVPDLGAIREALAGTEFAGAQVQRFGTESEVLVRLPPSGEAAAAGLGERILAVLPGAEMRRVEFVGPQVGDELVEDGILALLYALGGILVYVMLRFTWKFSLGAIVATIHDVVVTVGLFAVTRMEFDLTVLAAVLAVLGYSLNDTIVVFDRIRENFKRYRKDDARTIINRSINQTLARTLVTSGTTLVVVLALFVFGGELIHGFAAALVVGVLVGTYSTIWIASAMLLWLGVDKADLMPVQKEGLAADEHG